VIILSLIGLFTLFYVDIEIVEYGNYVLLNGTSNVYVFNTIDVTNNSFGAVNVQSFFVLVYIFMLMLSSVNLMLGKQYGGKKYED